MTAAQTSLAELAIPARYYLRVGEVLMSSGVDLPQLLQPLGLDLLSLSKPTASLSLAQIDRLLQSAVLLTQREDLGFELGRVLKLSSHDIVGFGILSSPNVDYALRLVSRFFRLILPAFQMRYQRDAEHMRVRFEAIAAMSPLCMHVHLEALATATHCELGELIHDRLPPCRIQLSMPEPAHAQRYRELPGAQVVFKPQQPPFVCLQFPASLAQQALSLADESALQMAEERCREMVRKVVSRRDVAGWVRMMLNEGGQGLPSLGELAHTLNMSIRTLDRHLKRENTGYRELLHAARLQRAKTLLVDGEQSITAIAHELGYSDAANFTRSFRKSTGQAPSEYRHQRR